MGVEAFRSETQAREVAAAKAAELLEAQRENVAAAVARRSEQLHAAE